MPPRRPAVILVILAASNQRYVSTNYIFNTVYDIIIYDIITIKIVACGKGTFPVVITVNYIVLPPSILLRYGQKSTQRETFTEVAIHIKSNQIIHSIRLNYTTMRANRYTCTLPPIDSAIQSTRKTFLMEFFIHRQTTINHYYMTLTQAKYTPYYTALIYTLPLPSQYT